jgi:L-asparagine oxygenase
MEQYTIQFTQEESKSLQDLASRIKVSPSLNPQEFCKEAKELSEQIPKRIREHLIDFAEKGSQTGYFLIQTNSKHDILTPVNNQLQVGKNTELAKIQAILIQSISEMIAYEAEGFGCLFQDIVPVKSMSREQTSIGSNTELEIHTEQAFSKLRPDILCLACLRGDPNALTYILPIHKIIDQMTREEKLLLREQLWKIGVDLSFKLHGKEFAEGEIRGPISIIYGEENDPHLTFDQDLMFSFCETGEYLLNKIENIYYKDRFQHNLTPGEIILIDNRRAVHGRSPFFPKYDGNDRFLVRCFSTFDYEKSAFARSGRMVNAIYS